MIQSLAKTIAVSVSSTILATLTVNAFDMRDYLPSTMLASLFSVTEELPVSQCPSGMVLVTEALEPFCVDRYEASASEACHYTDPSSNEETILNLSDPNCKPLSVANARPWRFVSRHDAEEACVRAGKRLLTPDEWYKAALGTPDQKQGFEADTCNVARNRADGAAVTGDGMRCVSNVGVYDMIGNVWEWVDAQVDHGVYASTTLPHSGYVTSADTYGFAYTTGTAQDERFGGDRFWSDESAVTGVMRGGSYDNGGQAGIFAVYAASPFGFSGEGVGFRCGSDTLHE